jgi:hypothetical protein
MGGAIMFDFDHINATLLQHPELLSELELLFTIKYWAFLILAAIFLYLAHFGDAKKESNRETDKDFFIS